jgi:alpha-tubulin suppressor-like RCC1 family protein
VRGLALCLLLLPLGCYHKNSYSCTGDNECVQLGVHGMCEPTGFCAFPDPACPGGDRYEQNAGGGLAGQCVPPGTGIDAPTDTMPMTCGGVGMPCCQGEAQACVGNAFCDSGTCKQCITQIALGNSHSCVLKYDGTVWCAGDNGRGQLGIGTVGGNQLVMRTVQVRDSANATISDATAIVTGQGNSCALRAGGTVWCWGKNDDGQTGSGATSIGVATQMVRASDGMPLTGMVSITTGHDMVCALDAGGTAWCWGENIDGQLGDGTTTSRPGAAPVLVAAAGAPFANVVEITTNEVNTACLRDNANGIWCWGNNDNGTIGDNTYVAKSSPVHVADGVSVAVGRRHVCAVENDHTVWCWGNGGHQRTATANGDSSVPAQSLSIANAPFGGAASVVAAGVSCALMMNGDLYCWGANTHGQTGTGIGTDRPMPVIRTDGAPLHNVTKVVANYAHTCALLADGEALCWGKGDSGEFGDGTKNSRNLPGPVPLTCP